MHAVRLQCVHVVDALGDGCVAQCMQQPGCMQVPCRVDASHLNPASQSGGLSACRAATLAQPVLPDPHGNVTEAGTLDAVLIARQRKLDESAGRWSGASHGGKNYASGLLSMRLLLLPAALFAYAVVSSARKSALWKTIMRMHRTGSRRTLMPK